MTAPQLANISTRYDEETDTEWVDATFDNGTVVSVTDEQLGSYFLRNRYGGRHILVDSWEMLSELSVETVLQDGFDSKYYIIGEDAVGEKYILDFETQETISFNDMKDGFPGARIRVVNITGV